MGKKMKGFRINASVLASTSIVLFSILYLLPITILIPEIIRKPLLILGLLLFVLALFFLKDIKYLLLYFFLLIYLCAYFFCSWAALLRFKSFMFPAFISIEFLICSFLIIDKKIIIPSKVIWLILLCALITSITSIIGLRLFPTAIRSLGQSSTDENMPIHRMYRQYNIAGWGLLFGIAYLEGGIVYLFKEKKKIVFIFLIICYTLCVLMSQLAFAIILASFLIFIVLINNKGVRFYICLLFFSFIIAFLWIDKETILNLLYDKATEHNLTILQLRVRNLQDLLVNSNTEGDAGARFELYLKSWDSFVDHPFSLLFAMDLPFEEILGFHSEFFDLLGALGIFGLLGIFLLIISFNKRIKKINDSYSRRFYAVMVCSFILLGVINPILSHPHIWLSSLLVPSAIIRNNWK